MPNIVKENIENGDSHCRLVLEIKQLCERQVRKMSKSITMRTINSLFQSDVEQLIKQSVARE